MYNQKHCHLAANLCNYYLSGLSARAGLPAPRGPHAEQAEGRRGLQVLHGQAHEVEVFSLYRIFREATKKERQIKVY